MSDGAHGTILGIDAYQQGDEDTVTDLRVIERHNGEHRVRWLGDDNYVTGEDIPKSWTCIGACSTAWSDAGTFNLRKPTDAEAVYADPGGSEWTTKEIQMEGYDNE